MTKQNDYEKLVETVAKEIELRRYKAGPGNATSEALARAAIALIRDRLATLTPEMEEAADVPFHAELRKQTENSMRLYGKVAYGSSPFSDAIWLAMLSASPLSPDTPNA